MTFSKSGTIKIYHGKDGKHGDSMFSQITYDEDDVYFTLIDGTTLEIPRWNS